MDLNNLCDQSLHQQPQDFVRQERTLVTKVQKRLQEVEQDAFTATLNARACLAMLSRSSLGIGQ